MAHKGQHSGERGGQVVKRAWQDQLLIVERLNIAFKGKDTRASGGIDGNRR